MVLGMISAFFAGLLAGEEVVVRFGVRGPLAALPDEPHIRLRQGLIRTLRILVPAIFVPALLTGVVAAVADASPVRWAAVVALAGWAAATFLGTVPINAAALAWSPAAPPPGWQATISRWEQLDSVRTAAAVLAFACALGGLMA
jgi:uncharacterized membrane protein